MEKSPDAFRTISEVAELLDTPAHVLRFWESRFPQIKPVKRAGGRRYYRPADVALLSGIRKLLHDEGMTIRGVQKILRDQGIRHVAQLGGEDSPPEIEALAESLDQTVIDESPIDNIVALTDWRSGTEADESPAALRAQLRAAPPPPPDEERRQWSLFDLDPPEDIAAPESAPLPQPEMEALPEVDAQPDAASLPTQEAPRAAEIELPAMPEVMGEAAPAPAIESPTESPQPQAASVDDSSPLAAPAPAGRPWIATRLRGLSAPLLPESRHGLQRLLARARQLHGRIAPLNQSRRG